MASIHRSTKDIAQLGQRIYDREIRPKVEKTHHGKYLAIDVDSGDYEIADEMFAAGENLRRRHPDSLSYLMRIGYRAAVNLRSRIKLKRK